MTRKDIPLAAFMVFCGVLVVAGAWTIALNWSR